MKKAALLILEKNEKILFARRSKTKESLPGRWSLPAETAEPGETIEETALRCGTEELDLNIMNLKLFDEYRFKDDKEEKILYFFKATYDKKPQIKATEELTELIFQTFDEFYRTHKDEEIGHGLQYLRKKLNYK